MKNTLTYNVALGCIITLLSYSVTAQQSKPKSSIDPKIEKAEKRLGHYQELKKMGYKDHEIFEDLGNANFLSENYETAIFWYDQLKEVNNDRALSSSYQKRYQFALQKTGTTAPSKSEIEKDWVSVVKEDYQLNNNNLQDAPKESVASKYDKLDLQQNDQKFLEEQVLAENRYRGFSMEGVDDKSAYSTPITVTADGNTAYFSKAVYVKPLYGMFSKKEMVHKIYKADKIDGQWKSIKEVALAPKNYSTKHPAVSDDGKRLFFASDMPGTFGEFDIYVSDIHRDGTFGVAKNLGQKVNTDKNDIYPQILDGNTLVFASEGHKGFGGLDVYMAQVDQKKVGLSVNLGSKINSMEDDFSIFLMSEKGMGYVMSNRGSDSKNIQRVAFSYPDEQINIKEEHKEYNILEALNNNLNVDYTNTTFVEE